ncbi:GFA family protein [Mesobaculum littorinae]|uniref:GFA family protein n=1 Tax=Mesobaculum littorinae TaxID=2486419 RepID=A0A438AG33_9RHOB|nr:GFA family protein [Mesobaculum littorinae]
MCGDVRFTARGVESDFGVCSCKMCQRWGGASFVAVTAAEVAWQGEEHIRRRASSDWAERGWCDTCGTHLFYRVTAPGIDGAGCHEIPLGLLDDTDGLRMTREIFTDRRPAAYDFAGPHERLTEARTLAMFAGGEGAE